jgi:hypothetical protein
LSMAVAPQQRLFAVCVNNQGFPASLEVRKLYEVVPDSEAAAEGLVRVIDESGEDYLYPAAYFRPLELSADVQQALYSAS